MLLILLADNDFVNPTLHQSIPDTCANVELGVEWSAKKATAFRSSFQQDAYNFLWKRQISENIASAYNGENNLYKNKL